MTIRIDTDSFNVEETKANNVYLVTATITQDGAEVTDPVLHTVTVKYNKGENAATLIQRLEAAIPATDTDLNSKIDAFKANFTEALIAPAEKSTEPQDMIVTGNLIINGQVIP